MFKNKVDTEGVRYFVHQNLNHTYPRFCSSLFLNGLGEKDLEEISEVTQKKGDTEKSRYFVAQLVRALDSGSKGNRFDSCRIPQGIYTRALVSFTLFFVSYKF